MSIKTEPDLNEAIGNPLILATKLVTPKSTAEIVFRKRLLDKLVQAGMPPLTLICAPAGFGKTTLAVEWSIQQQLPVAWVSLDDEDNDSVRWFRHLVAAIRALAPGFSEEIIGALNTSNSIKLSVLLPSFINQTLVLKTPVLLVLDDYHVIHNQEIHEALDFLLEQQPSNIRIAITSRTEPPLELAKLRARRQLCELTSEELRFSPLETEVFVNNISGLGLSNDDIQILTDRTEGWVAGLHLAVLSLAGEKDKKQFIRSFDGNNRYIMDYLMEEVLYRQPEDIKIFLLQTSILERLSGDLCDSVITTPHKSSQLLEELEKRKLFVIPLDNKRCWYRYHHLFAELLQHQLKRHQPKLVNELHCKASRWFRENNFPAEAMNHALTVESYDDAIQVLNAYSQRLFITGQLPLLLGWYARIPEEFIYNNPIQLLVCMWTRYVATGVFPQTLIDALNKLQLENLLEDEALKITVRFHVNNIHTYLHLKEKNTENALEKIDNCFKDLNLIRPEMNIEEKIGPIMNITTQSISLTIAKGFAYYIDGRYKEAATEFEKCIEDSFSNDFPITATSAIAYRALIYMLGGHLYKTIKAVNDGLKRIENAGWAHNFHDTTWCYYILAAIALEQNRKEDYLNALALIRNFPQKDVRGDIKSSILILEARQHYISGDTVSLENTIAEMERQPNDFIIPILPNMQAQRMKWLVRLGSLEEASQWLEARGINDSNPIKASQEFENIIWVRLKLAQNEPKKAIDKILKIIQLTESQKRFGVILELLILKSLALKQQGLLREADETLNSALSLAEPESYARIFADEGLPIAALLHRAITRSAHGDHAKYLLEIIQQDGNQSDTQSQEALSKKEIETLKLMLCGFSNKEISDKLFISVNTVKTHVKNIYSKLGVNSRAKLIAHAKSINL